MTFADELVKIRRMLRDPDGNIWSDDFLRHQWNDVQQIYQHQTLVLEDVHAQRVPGLFQYSYMYDHEYQNLPTEYSHFYQCLNQHDDYVICHRWEPQHITGIAADVSDYGAHFTQPWEACLSLTPGETIKFKFPANFNTMKFIAYDQEPISATTKKMVQSADPSYVIKEGEPVCYYLHDEADGTYVLYPRPSTVFANELTGEGMAFYASGDTEDVTTGVIAVREGSTDSDDIGVAVDIVDTADNLFMVYSVSPTDIESVADEPEIPVFLRKYINYGVISRAYGGNNDGRIRSLADYWEMRYKLGVEFTKRYMRNKRQDRDYRLTTRATSRRQSRHPRLPSAYPAVGP